MKTDIDILNELLAELCVIKMRMEECINDEEFDTIEGVMMGCEELESITYKLNKHCELMNEYS